MTPFGWGNSSFSWSTVSFGLSASVQEIIAWLLPFNLSGEAVIGSSVDVGSSSKTYARVYPNLISEIPAAVSVSEGMRVSYDTDEGATLGPELITDGDMSDPSSWTLGIGVNISGGKMIFTAVNTTTNTYQPGLVSPGGVYQVIVDIFSYTDGGLIVRFNPSTNGSTRAGTGVFTELMTANQDANRFFNLVTSANKTDLVVNNVSLKLVTPVFLHSVSKTDSSTLHPFKTGESGEEIYLLHDWHEVSTAYSLGDYIVTDVGVHNHWYTCTTAGTTAGTIPTYTDSGVQPTDGTAVFTYGGKYSNIASADTNYLPHVLNEPAATNVCASSRTFDGTGWTTATIGIAKDSIGIDGVTNAATTLTDSSVIAFASALHSSTDVGVSTNLTTVFRVGKTSSATSFPGFQVQALGSAIQKAPYTMNTDTGELTPRTDSPSVGTVSGVVRSFNSLFWEVEISVLGISSTIGIRFDCFPSVAATFTGAWTSASQGSVVIDQVDMYENSSDVSSPIPTTTGSVQRNATSFTVPNPLPANDFQMRGRGVLVEADKNQYLIDAFDSVSGAKRLRVWTGGDGNIYLREYDGVANRSVTISLATAGVTDGEAFTYGFSKSSTVGLAFTVNSLAGTTVAAGINSLPDYTTFALGSAYNDTSKIQGGITDLQIYTGSDADWYKDTTWSDPE